MPGYRWLRWAVPSILCLGGVPLLLTQVVQEEEHRTEGYARYAYAPTARLASKTLDVAEVPDSPPPPPPPEEAEGGVVGGVVGGEGGLRIPQKSAPADPTVYKPKLIRTSYLTLEVSDPAKARAELLDRLGTVQGWVAEQQETRDVSGRLTIDLQLKIPSDRFDASRQAFKALGVVRQERSETEDVSRDWVDREARLAVKRAAVLRLKQLLAQRTASLKDLLEAEKALVNETEEIESMEAIHREQASRVAFATLDVHLNLPQAHVSAALSPIHRLGERVLTRLSASLALLVLVGITLLPWGAAVGGAVYIYRRRRRRTLTNLAEVAHEPNPQ